jgi:Flp pilus assembly protein CpaB
VRNWRVLTAIAAVVLAIVAGVLAWRYLDEADERAQEDFETVKAFVSTGVIETGTTGAQAFDAGLIEEQDVVQQAVPNGAITDPAQITNNVAAARIPENSVITGDSFITPLEAQGGLVVPKGKQAISFSVDATRSVGGFVVPNDLVNVLVTFDAVPLGDTPAAEGETGITEELTTTAYLIPNLEVLAVGSSTATTAAPTTDTEDGGGGGQEVSSDIITVAVTPSQAQQIAHAQAQSSGGLYLSLNATGESLAGNQVPVEMVEAVNWFSQQLNCLNAVRANLEGGTFAACPLPTQPPPPDNE